MIIILLSEVIMGKPNKTLQADWRARRDFKAKMFDVMNAKRAEGSEVIDGADDERPEAEAMRKFFRNYPRCGACTWSLAFHNGRWMINIASSGVERAAALVALQEATSLPVVLCGPSASREDILLVRTEVAEMRRLNIWGA